MAPKLVFLDFDDTITDNSEADYYSFAKADDLFGGLGFEHSLTRSAFAELRKNGSTAEQILKRFIKDAEVAFKFNVLRRNLLSEYDVIDKIRLNDGVVEFLEYLKRSGCSVVIVTYKSNRRIVEYLLQKFSLGSFIDKIFCRDESDTRDPHIVKRVLYSEAMKTFEVEKENILVIGNSSADILSATEIGIRTVGVESKYLKREELERYCRVVSNLSELVNKL